MTAASREASVLEWATEIRWSTDEVPLRYNKGLKPCKYPPGSPPVRVLPQIFTQEEWPKVGVGY